MDSLTSREDNIIYESDKYIMRIQRDDDELIDDSHAIIAAATFIQNTNVNPFKKYQ